MKYDHEILLLQGGGALGAYQAGVSESWTAGLDDVRRSVSGWDKIRPATGPEVEVYRPTEALPSPEQASGRKKAKSEPVRR